MDIYNSGLWLYDGTYSTWSCGYFVSIAVQSA